jgi:hypothetical protein
MKYNLSNNIDYDREYFVDLYKKQDYRKKTLQTSYRRPTTTEDLNAMFPNPMDQHYMERTRQTMCNRIGRILHKRLQPGVRKTNGKMKVALGACEFEIFDHHMCSQTNTTRTCKTYTNDCDGLKDSFRIFYYEWPPLKAPYLGEYEWYVRDHGNGSGMFNAHLLSKYLRIKLSIREDDGRIECKFLQGTYAEVIKGKYVSTN